MELGLKMGMCGYDRMRGMQNRMKGGPIDMDTNGELVSEAASVARPGDATTTGHKSFLSVVTVINIINVVSIAVELHPASPTFTNMHAQPNSTPTAPSHSRVKEIHSSYMSRPASRVASTCDRGGDHGFGE